MDTAQIQSILVVDDEPSVLELICESLRIHGFDAIAAPDPVEALARMPKSNLTFALLDLNLNYPGKDGIDLARDILAYDPETIVIIMTGYQNLKVSVEASRRHHYRYLIKPFQIDQLIGVMERALWEKELIQENERLKEKVALLSETVQKLQKEAKAPLRNTLLPAEEREANHQQAGQRKAIESYQRQKRLPIQPESPEQ